LSKHITPHNNLDDLDNLAKQDQAFRQVIADKLVVMRMDLKRTDPSWSKQKLAEYFGVSESTYKRWETNGVDGITISFSTRYQQLFDLCYNTPEVANNIKSREQSAEAEIGNEFIFLISKFKSLFGSSKNTELA
jgi:transcriptional regulator with XRE-family HTH domain